MGRLDLSDPGRTITGGAAAVVSSVSTRHSTRAGPGHQNQEEHLGTASPAARFLSKVWPFLALPLTSNQDA